MEMPKLEKVVSDEEFDNLIKKFLEENNRKNAIIKENPDADIPQSETEKRLLEIDEHYNKITSDENLRKKFDYIVYNNYDKESKDTIIELVKKVLNDKEN